MLSRNSMAAAASCSSILDRAKPTWISTHSPGFGGSSDSRPMLISRLTPLTSTFARSGWSVLISMTSPGIPRHMRHLLNGELPEHLVDRGLGFLYPVDRGRRGHEEVVDGVKLGHLPSLVAGQADGEHPALAGLIEGAHQVRGVAARGQPDGDVAGMPERAELPREHHLDTDVVAQRGHHGRVAGKPERRQWPDTAAGMQEQRGDLLCVGGAASVAEGEQPCA